MKKKGAPCHGYWVGLDRSIPSVLSSKGAPGGRHCKFLWENWPNDERDDEFRPPGSSSLSVSYTAELNEVNASQAIKTWKKKSPKARGGQRRISGTFGWSGNISDDSFFSSYVGSKDAIRNFKKGPQALPNTCICCPALKLFPMSMSSVGNGRTVSELSEGGGFE